MDIDIIDLNENRLLEEIMKTIGATIEVVVPVSDYEEAKRKIEGIPENFGQYIRLRVGDKLINFKPEKGLEKKPEEILDKPKENPEKLAAIDPRIIRNGLAFKILKLSVSEEINVKDIPKASNFGLSSVEKTVKNLKENKLVTRNRGKIKTTQKGRLFLEEYEKKNGKVELPEKVVIQKQEGEKPKKEVKPELEKPKEQLSEEEKIAQIQVMKTEGQTISAETVSKKLGISIEESSLLIEKSEKQEGEGM